MKTKLQKLQQDPTWTAPMSMVGIKPEPFVNLHDYHVMKESEVQDAYDQDRYISLDFYNWKQIRADAMLSRQIYNEEQKQYEEQIKHVENKRPHEYHLNQMKDKILPNHSNFVTRDKEDPPNILKFLTNQQYKHLN